MYRLGLRLKKDNDSAGATISHQSKLPYTTIVTTIQKSVPLWVYIVSIMCGLLLLILTTYGMYRLGFFQRKKREELAQLHRQVRRGVSLLVVSSVADDCFMFSLQSKMEAEETEDDD